jgi:hypothetical protein
MALSGMAGDVALRGSAPLKTLARVERQPSSVAGSGGPPRAREHRTLERLAVHIIAQYPGQRGSGGSIRRRYRRVRLARMPPRLGTLILQPMGRHQSVDGGPHIGWRPLDISGDITDRERAQGAEAQDGYFDERRRRPVLADATEQFGDVVRKTESVCVRRVKTGDDARVRMWGVPRRAEDLGRRVIGGRSVAVNGQQADLSEAAQCMAGRVSVPASAGAIPGIIDRAALADDPQGAYVLLGESK